MDETDESKIDLSEPYVLLEKLDGIMVAPFMTMNALKSGVKNGCKLKQAKKVQKFVDNSKIQYKEFSNNWVQKGWTPIFEFVSPEKLLVVEYKEPQLILTALRNNLTGEYMLYEDLVKEAKKYDIPVVTAWRLKSKTVRELVQEIRGIEGVEGCVLRMEECTKLKHCFM